MRVFATILTAMGLLFVAGAILSNSRGYQPRIVPPRASVLPVHQRVVSDPDDLKVRAKYRIENIGGRDLVFGRVQTSCGCSIASIEPRSVRPGGHAIVTVVGDALPAGEKDVMIQIDTNSMPEPILSLRLTMVGVAPVPYIANHNGPVHLINDGSGFSPGYVRVGTRERVGEPPWITRAESGSMGLTAQGGLASERPIDSRICIRNYEYDVVFDGHLSNGSFNTELAFFGDDHSKPILTLPVVGRIDPPVRVSPGALYASLGAGSEPPDLHLVIEPKDANVRLKLDLSEESRSILQVEELRREGSRVILRLRPRSVDRELETTIRIHTDHPDARIIEVPLLLRMSRDSVGSLPSARQG